jgi:hypothetical protein
LISIVGGQAASIVQLAPTASIFATGAMSAGYAGGTASLTYTDTEVIDFSAISSETVTLDLLGFNVLGAGFHSLQFTFSGSDGFTETKTFTTLGSAETFFTNDKLNLLFAAGSQSVNLYYSLTANSGAAEGFGFNFNIDPPLAPSTVPEPSTWAMMLMGFAGLAFAAFRRGRKGSLALSEE